MARYDKAHDVKTSLNQIYRKERQYAERNFGGITEMRWAMIDMDRSGKRGTPTPTRKHNG